MHRSANLVFPLCFANNDSFQNALVLLSRCNSVNHSFNVCSIFRNL